MDFVGIDVIIDAIANLFQLSYVDSIRRFSTSSHTRDLAGHGAIGLANRNSCIRRFPSGRRISRRFFRRRIITRYTRFPGGYRTSTDGYAAFNSGIGTIAENGDIFLIRCQWICLIS